MSYCTIERNELGQITRVNKPDGSESRLYTKIAKHPLVKTTEVAADLYKNIYSERVNKVEEDIKPVKAVKGNTIFNFAIPEVSAIEEEYSQLNGITEGEFTGVTSINKGRAKVIAQLFDELENDPNSSEVKEAYEAMAKETIAQYELIKSKGYTIEVNNEEPYANSSEMLEDLRDNKSMRIFSTESGFGSEGITAEMRAENPLLAETKFKDVTGKTLLVNDVFRFVHDFFGHAKLGNGFGAIGEENAWNVHARMYSPLARRAMTTETRGQNSWVNFSGVNDEVFAIRNEARKLRAAGKTEEANKLTDKVYSKMKFADQKVGLLPEWVSSIDYEMNSSSEAWGELTPVQQATILGYELKESGSTVVDGKGEFKYSKATTVPVEEIVDKSLMNEAELKLLDYWGSTPIRMYGGRGQSDGMASYNTVTKEISINVNNKLGGVVLSDQKEVNNAILHEIIHHVINNEVTDREAFDKELSNLREIIISNKSLASDYVKSIINYIEGGSVEEVITYSLTNKPFAEFMDSISYEQENGETKTVWDRLVEFITGLLKSNTLLTAVRDVVNKYASSFNTISDMAVEKFDYELSDVVGASVKEYKRAETKAMEGHKASNNRVDLQYDFKTEQELKAIVDAGGKLFLTKDGKAGAFVKADGNMGGLFKDPSSNKKGASKVLQEVRIQEGGTYFDSYATKLESIYIENGFKPVARLKFNPSVAPKGWDKESSPLKDKPDVVLFKYEPNSGAKPGDGVYFKTFEEAEAFTKSNLQPETLEDKVDFVHRLADGTIVESFKETLLRTQEGGTIEVGLMVDGEFSPILLSRKNTNKNTEQGYINNLIQNGLLSEVKTKVGVDYEYEAAGGSEFNKTVSAMLIQEEAGAYLGNTGVVKNGFNFRLEKTNGRVKVMTKLGEVKLVERSELDTKSYEELKAEFENATSIVTQREWEASKVAYREAVPVISQRVQIRNEEELQLSLLNFLNKLGVRTMSINEYTKKYKLKHGVNPSAKALADIANQVVAYTQGDTESLSEETAHFINEAFPRERIENILRNIHRTAEWTEFNKKYRDIYAREYSGEALEDVVRREVLGKIVAKVISGQVINENSSETQKNIFARVLDTINEFFEALRNLFKPEYSSELNQYLNEVEELLSAEDVTDYVNIDNFKHSTIRLYNVGNSSDTIDKLRKHAKLLVSQLTSAEKNLRGTGISSKTKFNKLREVERKLEDSITVESITSLASMVNANTKALQAALKDSELNNKEYPFSNEENIVYQDLKHISSKALSEVKVLLDTIKKETKTKDWDNIIQEIEGIMSSVRDLVSKASLSENKNVERLVNKVMDEWQLPEEERQDVLKWVEKAESDTNVFHATFGQMLHAKDGLLNLTNKLIGNMNMESHDDYYKATKEYQEILDGLGVTAADIGNKFVDGGFIVSEYDWNKHTEVMDYIYAISYKKTIEKSIKDKVGNPERLSKLENIAKLDIKDIISLKNKNQLEVLSLEEETFQKNVRRPMENLMNERTMVDSYYEEYEAKLNTAKISDVTKQKLSNYLSDISTLKKKAFRKEGGRTILDWNSLSEFDKSTLSNLHKDRKLMKSYTNEFGQLKPGLKYSRVGGEIELDPKTKQPVIVVGDVKQLTDESIVALDLNKLDNEFTNEQIKQGAQLFYDTLDRIDREEGRESAIKFLEANTYTSLSQDFWDGLNTRGDIVSRLINLRDNSPELRDEINNIIFNIKKGTFEIKNILKTHNKKNNPSEIEVDGMSTTTIDTIKQLQTSLKKDIQTANRVLRNTEDIEIPEGFLSGVSEVNESYRKELMDLDIFESSEDSPETSLSKAMEEFNYAKNHMTSEDASRMDNYLLDIEYYLLGTKSDLSLSVKNALERMENSTEDVADTQVKANLVRTMVRSRLLPYYKRYTSEAYNSYMEGLQSTGSLSEYLKNGQEIKDAFVEVSPNPTFFDVQENEQINPKYKKDFIGGYLQPKLSDIEIPNTKEYTELRGIIGNKISFRNNRFEEMFGAITNGVASKDNNLYKSYLATLDYNNKVLEAMNMGDTYNNYMLPQSRQIELERYKNALKGRNFKNLIKDTFNYTEDDMIQGDTNYGSDIKVIPKKYVNKLENPEDISTDLFYSMTLRAKEAYQYKARNKYYGDIMSVYDKISTREMNGKDPKTSNSLRMVKSAVDYNMFGIREIVTYPVNTPFGTVDFTKLARLLLSFVKFRNLGMNFIIPITSMMTGEVTRKIESTVGELIDSRSQALGTREFRKIAQDGMKEIGETNTKAKVNVLGQFFKSYDMDESFKNSNYGKWMKLLPRLGMILHTGANFALYGKTTIGVLHDFRIIEGEMINKNTFLKKKKAEGQPLNEAKKAWESAEDMVMYKYLVHEGNKMSWNKEALKSDLNKDGETLNNEELDLYITDMHNRTQRYISLVNSLIDGQIPESDKVLAQRHYLFSYFMTHRGWESIAISRRFKNRHRNFDTGLLEEGSYRSFYHYFGQLFKEMQKSNFTKFISSFKKAWEDPTNFNEPGISDSERNLRLQGVELARRNMRRVFIEASIVSGLMILATALRSAADDEDNKDLYALQLTNYLTYRTLNELSSVQLNLSTNLMEAVEEPFVGMNTVKNLFDIGELFSGEEVKYGTYRGLSERRRYLTKMVPGMKQYFDLQNMNQTYNTYKFYNAKNFSLTPTNLLWLNTVDAKD